MENLENKNMRLPLHSLMKNNNTYRSFHNCTSLIEKQLPCDLPNASLIEWYHF